MASLKDPPGLIPAHAGKTITLGILKRPSWAHPRSGGENTVTSVRSTLPSGSSPLAQGKLRDQAQPEQSDGLIPAHAGKTTFDASRCSRIRAHPHSRGENAEGAIRAEESKGSSPLTRGKPSRAVSTGGIRGLIPTHAGKTPRHAATAPCAWAHPHSRGENWISGAQLRGSEGSSPLTRGKRRDLPVRLAEDGLIPTHAGKTVRRSRARRPCRAHPHSHGENDIIIDGTLDNVGSSPLTRGKLLTPGRAAMGHGLIPTHAGKTHWESPPGHPRRAHPHSRGENTT